MTREPRLKDGMRKGLADAVERSWKRLAGPGTWWTGAERLAIAAESRHALTCNLCRRSKAVLSPGQVEGRHDTLGVLPDVTVDAIHRITTDAGRLSSRWLAELQEQGLDDTHYVEIAGVIATLSGLDTLERAMGRAPRGLPEPIAGEPSRHRPAGARHGMGWLPTLTPEDLETGDPDCFTPYGSDHIQRALSLVPEEVIGFFDLDTELYFFERGLPQRPVQEAGRAISPAQIELIAARAAALNGCHY